MIVGTHRLDLVVDDKIVLELKASSAFTNEMNKVLQSYLTAAGLSLGILINFGASRVESVRIVKT